MQARWLLGLMLLVMAFPAAAEPKQAKPARPAAAKTARKPARPVIAVPPRVSARAVEVLWGGQWWAAEVLETRGGSSRIHYTGWGSEWDEWVGPDRLRAAPPKAPVVPLKSARVGQKVEVEWHGAWWPAQVIQTKNGFFKIRYTGYGSEWDEWIELDRMRSPSSRTERAPSLSAEIVGS